MDKPIRVMLVEDDPFLQNMYTTKLKLSHFDVTSATDGKEAWDKIQEAKPDIVLLDVMLPTMDGFEILTEIRKHAELKDTPVIMLTNLSKKEEVDKGLQLGANDYLIKAHFMPSEVVQKITKLLGK